MIDKAKLLEHLHAKMDRFEGEKQRGIAGIIGAIESGTFDIIPTDVDRVNLKVLRSLAGKFNPSPVTGALYESAKYIESLEAKLAEKEAEVKRLKGTPLAVSHAELRKENIKLGKQLNQAVEALEKIKKTHPNMFASHSECVKIAHEALQSIKGEL